MLITITGSPCSGKSTVSKLLVDEKGFDLIAVGDVFKREAKKRNMSTEEFNAFCMSDPSYDFFLDEETKKLGTLFEGQKIIFDSRLAWHFVPKSFKVYVKLDDETTAQRLVSSDREGKEKYDSIEEARTTLENRRNLEKERYQSLYQIDITDLNNFDFVIDSGDKTPEQVMQLIYEAYEKFVEANK